MRIQYRTSQRNIRNRTLCNQIKHKFNLHFYHIIHYALRHIFLQLHSLGDDPNFEFSDEVVIREKAIRVSGKLGGVAGVLHGVI